MTTKNVIFTMSFGFMLGWLFTIYIAGRFDTFGIAANWKSVASSCFAAADVQGKLIDRLSIDTEKLLPIGTEIRGK